MGGFIKGQAVPIMVGDDAIEVNGGNDALALYNAIQNHLLITRDANAVARLYTQAYIQCLHQFGADEVLRWNLPGMGGKIEDSVRHGLLMHEDRGGWNYLERSISNELERILRGVLPILQIRRAAEAAHD
jgi:hypothetical protein